jgi:hypothetical protein
MGAIRNLIKAGATINEYGWRMDFVEIMTSMKDAALSPLGQALSIGDSGIVQLLIENRADIGMEARTIHAGHKEMSPLPLQLNPETPN